MAKRRQPAALRKYWASVRTGKRKAPHRKRRRGRARGRRHGRGPWVMRRGARGRFSHGHGRVIGHLKNAPRRHGRRRHHDSNPLRMPSGKGFVGKSMKVLKTAAFVVAGAVATRKGAGFIAKTAKKPEWNSGWKGIACAGAAAVGVSVLGGVVARMVFGGGVAKRVAAELALGGGFEVVERSVEFGMAKAKGLQAPKQAAPAPSLPGSSPLALPHPGAAGVGLFSDEDVHELSERDHVGLGLIPGEESEIVMDDDVVINLDDEDVI